MSGANGAGGRPGSGRLAGAVFALQTAGSGVAVYALPLYIAAFAVAGIATPAELSVASAAYFLASASSGAVFGRVPLARAVPLLAGAVVLGALALSALAVAPVLPVIVVAFAALGVSFNGAVVVGTALLVDAYRGRATGGMALATAGSSAGGIVVSPVLALLLGRGFDAHWLALVAGAFLAAGLAAVLVIRSGPRPTAGRAEETGADLRTTTMAGQWPLLVALSLVTASQLGATSYGVALGVARGIPAAGLAVTVTTAAAVASRWLGAVGIRRLGLHRWTLVSFGGQALGVLLIGAATSTATLFAGGALVGQSLGNTLLIRSQVVVELFGIAPFSRRFGQLMTFTSLGSAIGPLLLGQTFGLTGSWTAAYLAGFGLNLLAVPFLTPWVRRGRAARLLVPAAVPVTAGRPHATCVLEEDR